MSENKISKTGISEKSFLRTKFRKIKLRKLESWKKKIFLRIEFWKIRTLENYLKIKICFGKLNFDKKKMKINKWATRE